MPFIIKNQNLIVSTERTFKDVAEYFKKLNIRGLSERTLKTKLDTDGALLTKGDYEIEKIRDIGKYERESKAIKNAEILEKGEVFKTVEQEFIWNNATADTEVIEEPAELIIEYKLINYKTELMLNQNNIYEIARNVMNEIKKEGESIIKKRTYRAIFKLSDGFDEIGVSYKRMVSTRYLFFNDLYRDIIILLEELIGAYEHPGDLKYVEIKYIDMPEDKDLLIYGNNNKRIDAYIASMKNLIDNMIINDEDNKKLIKISNENYIYRPKTIKNCFIKSCYMAKYKQYDVIKKTEKFIERNPIECYKLEEMANFISLKLKIKITVYILSNGLNKYVYNKGSNKEEINILIIGNHAHALINKNDITDFNRAEFNLLMDIKEAEEEQILILKKHVKKLKEENNEEQEGGEEAEEEKYNKYKDHTICTYDFETCDKSAKGDKKEETIPYAVGFYDGIEYKEIYKKDRVIDIIKKFKDYMTKTKDGEYKIKGFMEYMESVKKPAWSKPKEDDIVIKFLDYLDEIENKKMILYGHNAGKFDLYLLVKHIMIRKNWTIFGFLEQAGRIINLEIGTWEGKNILFRDSFNFISTTLDKACKGFKPKTVKLEGDVNHNLININNCTTYEIYKYTSKYLKNDCLSLHEILIIYADILIKTFNIDIKSVLTNASIARQYFLDKFYDEKKTPIYTLPKSIDTNIRKYYFGGRNECMTKLGYKKGKFYYLDFTSLYPYMMQKHEYPQGEVETLNIEDNKFNNDWFGFVKCKFRHVKKDNIPYHAVLKNHKLTFPYCDNWQESILTTEEIKYSIDENLGYEYYFYEVYNYKQKDYIFKECVEDVYKLKLKAEQAGNAALRSMAKIIINSLYGFWGINFYNREQVEIVNFRDDKNNVKKNKVIKTAEEKRQYKVQSLLLTQKLKGYDRVGKYCIFSKVDKIKTKCANVGLAFFTTAYARTHLYKLLKEIKEKGGNIYYMDTDSVITDFNIYEDEEMRKKWVGSGGEGLGELKNETGAAEGFYKEIITLGNKFYGLKNEELEDNKIILKMKGVNGYAKYEEKEIDKKSKTIYYKKLDKFKGKHKITFEDYKLMSEGYNLNVSNMAFLSGVNSVIIGRNDLLKLSNKKNVKQMYDKGEVDKDFKIKPLTL